MDDNLERFWKKVEDRRREQADQEAFKQADERKHRILLNAYENRKMMENQKINLSAVRQIEFENDKR